MAVQAEYDAKKQLIKNSVVADKKRRKVCLDARDKAKGILIPKIDIKKIESMNSNSVRGWLKTAKNASRPIMDGAKLIET